jgi:GMP synthase (glutamine-hydrolysing)
VIVVKTGATLPSLAGRRGDYEAWIAAGLGLGAARVSVARVCEGEALPAPQTVRGAVITGSSAMVSRREAWSEDAAAWLSRAVSAGTPVLGICYGHQLLAHALGGRVGLNPRGREIGSIDVHHCDGAGDDPLFAALPNPLRVQATHLEAVLELPPGARHLAWSALDPHQAFAVGERAWGMQFHPEFDADVIRAYLEERRDIVRSEGLDADALLSDVTESGHGRAVLRRFAELLSE